MILLDIVTFLGRLHPLVVHLPIGFLFIGAAFDLLSHNVRYRILKEAVPITLLAGFVSAVIACIMGYLLSLDGEYDRDILGNHRLAGIMLAIASGILWSMTTPIYAHYVVVSRKVFTALYVGLVAMVAYTGHQGGSLTHGSDYLSLETLTHEKRVIPVKAEEAMIFEDVVHPVLERRCGACHRKGKRKGELVITAYHELMKGGKNGAVIVAGKLDQSELYRRITLDPSHEDFMPTDGKTPLTKTETELIRWWIEKGDAQKETKVTSVEGYESMLPLIASVLELPGASPSQENILANLSPVNPLIPATTDMTAIDNLRRKGLSIRIMLHTPVMLDVTLPSASGLAMQEIQKDLSAVGQNVIWLNLSDNSFTESDLSILRNMTNLEKLRLEKNPIGDSVVDLLSELKHLESLNLNETRLTDEGLVRLKQHPSLKRIYTWKTLVQQSN